MGLGMWDYSFFQGSRVIWFPLVQEQKVQPAAKILRFTVPGEPKAHQYGASNVAE